MHDKRNLRLGYVGVEVSDVAAHEAFATDLLGVELAQRLDDGGIHLRWDEYATRMTVRPGSANDIAYAGWEVGNAEEQQVTSPVSEAPALPADGECETEPTSI